MAELSPLVSQLLPMVHKDEVGHYPDARQVSQHFKEKPYSICFLDFASDENRAFGVLASITEVSKSTQVIALLGNNDPNMILRCLRSGATEFLLSPITAEQLQPTLERLSQLGGGGGGLGMGGGKVIAVVPVKGAVGATTISANLVTHWVKGGKRKILLADMDPYAGTLSFLLKIKSNYSFLDALSRSGSLDADLWKGLVTSLNGMDILLSPENPVDASGGFGDPVDVIDFMRNAYDMTVLDLAAPFSRWSLHLAAVADELLVVTTNELPSLRSTQRLLLHFERNHIGKSKIRLVVNRYNPDVGLNEEAIETALHSDVYHLIPSDYDAAQRALVEGKPINPSCGLGKSLNALATKLLGANSSVKDAPKKKSGSWTSIFTSLMSRATS